MNLKGWRTPGRTISDKLHSQMFGIMDFLKDSQSINNNVWGPPLQLIIGETIDVQEESTLRHIIGFMKSIGILYSDALESGKIPNSKYCVTPRGEVLYSLISMERLAKDKENNEVLKSISNMYQDFYANAFIYWYVRDTKVHVARTILKAIRSHGYLDKIEWFIINTIITETDNEIEEQNVDKYINAYRSNELALTMDNIKSRINSYNYWTQLLSYAGLIIKTGNKIYMGKGFSELTEALLAEDFLQTLKVEDRYNLKL
jgi:hypothetical protein